jgi:hypothetical protein
MSWFERASVIVFLTLGSPTPALPQVAPATDTVPLDEVIKLLKENLRVYEAYAASHQKDRPSTKLCNGNINLYIDTATIVITTKIDVTDARNYSAKVPLDLITVGQNYEASVRLENSQGITFTVHPERYNPIAYAESIATKEHPIESKNWGDIEYWRAGNYYPIAVSLMEVREALLKTRDTHPCFTLAKLQNTYRAGFTVTRSKAGGGNLTFGLFSLGASRAQNQSAANTLEISFKAE